jgi:hypothetical protein
MSIHTARMSPVPFLVITFTGNTINGVAPKATVIPVKVLNQNGSGWSSVVAAGIAYIGDSESWPFGMTTRS